MNVPLSLCCLCILLLIFTIVGYGQELIGQENKTQMVDGKKGIIFLTHISAFAPIAINFEARLKALHRCCEILAIENISDSDFVVAQSRSRVET